MPSRYLRIPILPLPFGLRTQRHPYFTSGNIQMENWWISPDDMNAIEVVPGAAAADPGTVDGGGSNIRTIGYGESKDLERFVYSTVSTKVLVTDHTGTTTELNTGLTAGRKYSIVTYGNHAHFYNGADAPFKHANFSSVTPISPGTPPVVTSTTFAGSGTGPLSGTYYWWVAYERTDSGGVITQTPISAKIGPFTSKDKSALLSSIPVDPSPPAGGSSRRLIFRSVAGGPDPFLSGTIDNNTTTTFTDSTADVELSNPPDDKGGEDPPETCNYAVVHYNRVWIAGDEDAPSKVYFSGLGDPDDFSTDRWFLDIWQNDGDRISGLAASPGGILVWKNHHMYIAVGQDPEAQTMDIQMLVPADQNYRTVGTPSHWSIAATPEGHFFYYNRAFWMVDGSGVVERISSGHIEDQLRDDVNVAAERTVQSVYHPELDIVICSVPTGASVLPNRTYIWHRGSRTFTRLGWGHPAMAMVERGTDGSSASSQELWGNYLVSSAADTVLKLFDEDQNTIDGDTITATLQLPPIYMGTPGEIVLWKHADLTFEQASGGELTFKFGTSGSTLASATVDMSSTGITRLTRDIGMGIHGHDIDIQIISAQTATRPKLYSLNLWALPRGRYQRI